jgi:hypothetical protein
MDPLFLLLDEVLEIHAQQIELYGGSDGVRDPAGLESAVATPMATFGGLFLHSSLPSMAAAYLVSHKPEPPVRGRQQADGSERRHHIPDDQRLGA